MFGVNALIQKIPLRLFRIGGILFLLIVSLPGGPSSLAKEPRGLADETPEPALQQLQTQPARDEAVPAPPEDVVPPPVEIPPTPPPAEESPLPPEDQTGPSPPAPAESAPSLEEGVLPLEIPPPVPTTLHLRMTPKRQWVSLTRNAYKAEEFRILPEGLYLDHLNLSMTRENQALDLSLHHLLLMEEFRSGRIMEDSYGTFLWDRYGLTKIELDYRKSPHLYASGLQGSLPSLAASRDRQDIHIRFTPADTLSLRMDLTVEERQGSRPLPTENVTSLAANGKISATAVVEVAEPIHETATTLSLGAEYVGGPLVLRLENKVQIFNNNETTEMVWDNPYRNLSGRAKLPEDHWVQTLTVQPSYRISDRWLLMNSLSYLQVSSRINLVSFSTDPNLGNPVPYPAIEPDVRSLFFHTALTGELSDRLSLKIRYRRNSYENDTLIIAPHPAYVLLEEEVKYERTPVFISHRQSTLEMETSYRPARWGTFQGGIRQTVRSRNQREVSRGTEWRYYLNARGAWTERLAGDAGYARLQVDQDPYDAGWLQTTYDPRASESQHPLLRALDLARSTAEEYHGGLTYRPLDPLSAGLQYTAENRTYPDTLVGRQSSEDRKLSLDFQYSPTEQVLAFAQYTYRKSDFRGRYTWTFNPAIPSPSQDPTYIAYRLPRTEIVSDQTDDYQVGIDYDPSPRTRLTGQYLISWTRTSDLIFPSTEYRYDAFSLEAYRKIPGFQEGNPQPITLSLEYRYERSRRVDYTLDNLPGPGDPANPAAPQDLYLGIVELGYTAHVISVSCTFDF